MLANDYSKIFNLITQTKISKYNLENKEIKDLIDAKDFEFKKNKNKEEALNILSQIFDEI